MSQEMAMLKVEITSALDFLPPESLRLLREFVAFLRSRAGQAAPQEGRIVKLGGLWEGYTFTEEEIEDIRKFSKQSDNYNEYWFNYWVKKQRTFNLTEMRLER